MIVDGWSDWAERVPGHESKVNGWGNPAQGFVAHSAEGWETALRSMVADPGRRASWHFSNLLDGRLLQHYPLNAQCWHGNSGYPNNNFCSMEHEGLAGHLLTPAQVETTTRIIAEISGTYGWSPRRPAGEGDKSASLYEHRECTRFGSAPTDCPSGRIPWDEIMARLAPPPAPPLEASPMAVNLNADGSKRIEAQVMEDGREYIVIVNNNVPVLRIGGELPGRIAKNFGGNWVFVRGLDDAGDWNPQGFYPSLTPGD